MMSLFAIPAIASGPPPNATPDSEIAYRHIVRATAGRPRIHAQLKTTRRRQDLGPAYGSLAAMDSPAVGASHTGFQVN